jgi:glutamine synthetase
VRFLLFLAAVLKAVHKHSGLLRASVASSGNEHRLGANEAPPAIISVFMGDTLTRMINSIVAGKGGSTNAAQALIRLGVNKLPEIERDNTDRNRTSPFAFTGAKFEFRAVGGGASIAFPVMLLNATVAEALTEITATLRPLLKNSKSVDDAVLKVVREVFKETTPIRFEGNNYSDAWVKEAEKRGLPNFRRTPEALGQMLTKQSRALFQKLGILSKEELESRYHVRIERYVKDMLIELTMLREMVDTMVLPACFSYCAMLVESASNAKNAGVAVIPQTETANRVARLIQQLQTRRNELVKVIEQAEGMHDAPEKQAKLLTSEGAERMAEVRDSADTLELIVADEQWPLPKYREILFPV